jgi:LacI family transcriptional regulator
MNLTLKDIADALGISVPTVSKALKGYKDVSPATREKVLDYTKKVQFKPNTQAAFLRTKQTKLIGLIFPKIDHDFFAQIINGVLSNAAQWGYQVILLCSDESYEIEKKHIHDLIQLNVDGIFISIAKTTNRFEHIKKIHESNTSLVVFDRYAKIIPSHRVVIDDKKAAFKATEHLIQMGCDKIAYLRGDLISQISIDRFLGYKEALSHYHISFNHDLALVCQNNSIEEGRNKALELLKKKRKINGLFAVEDLLAIGAMKEFQKQGFKIPEDIACLGFSNWKLDESVSPPLSSVEQNGFLMGSKVFEVFIRDQKNNKEGQSFFTEIIPSKIIIRESTALETKT